MAAGYGPAAVFAEVECREEPALCRAHAAGSGGWPTVVAFHEGAPGGARFPREAGGSVCDEIVSPGRCDGYVRGLLAAAGQGAGAGASAGGEL